VGERSAPIHPGRIIQCFDHFVIDLHASDGGATYFTVYAVEYSPALGTGHVSFLRTRDSAGIDRDFTFTDRPDTARNMQARLRGMETAKVDMSRGIGTSLTQEPVMATFRRHPWTVDGVGWTIWPETGPRIEARWLAPQEPVWTAAMAGTFTPTRDILGMLAEFGEADLQIDGERVPGEPWHDPWWDARVGRPFSSTHVALAESSLEPAGAEWWDGLRG
jgi:hypothetical protein